VVRAAVRFAEPVEDPHADNQQSRRIQVRAAVRHAPEPRQVPVEGGEAPQSRPEPVRRSVSVRRVEEPPVEEPEQPISPTEAPAVPPRTAPVRRIAVTRPERAAPVEPRVVAMNGNGKHDD
jgi:hypothetical protein